MLNLADVCLDACCTRPSTVNAIFEQEAGTTSKRRHRSRRATPLRRPWLPRKPPTGLRASAERRGVQRDEGRAVRSEFGAVRRAAGGAVPRHGLPLRVGRHAARHPRPHYEQFLEEHRRHYR
ncbi:MAG: hypothetical protein ACLSVD_01275 [Eggerthellaceae bacterium]